MDVSAPVGPFDPHRLAPAVAGARDLLRYAAQAGIAVPDATIGAIVHAVACETDGHLSEDDAVAFYAALTTLAAKVAPVTVDTLRVSDAKTCRSLRLNGIIAVVLALIVVIFSGVAFITTSMSKDIESGIGHANELAVKLRDQVGPPKPGNADETECGPATHPPDLKIPFADEAALIAELQDFSATIRMLLRTATKLDFFVADWEVSPLDHPTADWKDNAHPKLELEPGLVNMRKDSFCKIATYQDVRDFAQNVRADCLAIYGALSAYLLPVLYALLGAFAYNLRDFSDRVKRRTYHPSSYANTARTIAALTAGAIISLFNNFNPEAALQPLAFAFLVGYGVEAFFAFLDTLLAAFSARNGKQATPARPSPP